jgi:hypothetical protein
MNCFQKSGVNQYFVRCGVATISKPQNGDAVYSYTRVLQFSSINLEML